MVTYLRHLVKKKHLMQIFLLVFRKHCTGNVSDIRRELVYHRFTQYNVNVRFIGGTGCFFSLALNLKRELLLGLFFVSLFGQTPDDSLMHAHQEFGNFSSCGISVKTEIRPTFCSTMPINQCMQGNIFFLLILTLVN